MPDVIDCDFGTFIYSRLFLFPFLERKTTFPHWIPSYTDGYESKHLDKYMWKDLFIPHAPLHIFWSDSKFDCMRWLFSASLVKSLWMKVSAQWRKEQSRGTTFKHTALRLSVCSCSCRCLSFQTSKLYFGVVFAVLSGGPRSRGSLGCGAEPTYKRGTTVKTISTGLSKSSKSVGLAQG